MNGALDFCDIRRYLSSRGLGQFLIKHFGLLWWKFTESYETQIVKQLVKPAATAVDIGANIGYYTLLLADLVGPQGKVFAFEPEPKNFNLLERNVKKYGYTNVVCIPKAVNHITEMTQLYVSLDNPGDHRSYKFNNDRFSIPVEGVSMDDYFSDYPKKIDFIKVDVQGAEESVLKGMKKLIEDKSKSSGLTMLLEFWPTGLREYGVDPQEHLQRLSQMGFKLKQLNSAKKRMEPLLDPAQLVDKLGKNYLNFLCVQP